MALVPPALLFDLDGTLADSARPIAAALSTVNRARGGDAVDLDDVRRWVSLGAERLVANALGGRARDPADDVATFRRMLGDIRNGPELLYPGVADALHGFSAAGAVLGVVTNKPVDLAWALLRDMAIDTLFGAVVGGDSTMHAKPHPAPMALALSLVGVAVDGGVPAGTCLYVGDSDVDAAAARGAGIPFVLFTGGYGAEACAPADVAARFDTFAQLPGLIARLMASFER